MPEAGVAWLPKDDLLSFEEIADVVRAAIEVHGIRRFKLTGGEPTVRHGLVDLVAMLRKIDGVEDLSLTTNGQRLEDLAQPLREAGLDRVTVSVDSLKPDRFKRITRTGELSAVLRGLDRTLDVGFAGTKINCVAMRGTNDDEFADFARLTVDRPLTVRFIEYMPLGDAQVMHALVPSPRYAGERPGEGFRPDARSDERRHSLDPPPTLTLSPAYRVEGTKIDASESGPAGGCGAQDRGDVFVSETEIRESIERELGDLVPVDRATEPGVGPAIPYRLSRRDAVGRIGFISAMSAPFCATCNRLRLTATGVLRSCLFEGGEVDVRPILRDTSVVNGRRLRAVADAMTECVRLKPDVHSSRGNEQMSRIGG
jgi:cyclic pyranopterin phosphate synthase